ncbi:hypothetical protein BWQ96_03428 [Gracilariopsis chorda]|uniref:RING-type domain-containing protein n=1 Tax=Gracilariopsis chorda TaxID=448386 RepID=A0A2V3IXR5_9FLOR|nr:hypothetical protein BWQ96_03428 [Gracilariopsis chorda]|eukprot:PXF46899.1 hypothetical protein BWQ96_03428 [Gracilariopsis chorda]
MYSSSYGIISSKERRRRRREARNRLQAIASFLIRSERRGLRISPHAQYLIENECLDVYKAYDESPDTFEFATMLRETAVRMFRQGRYKEANQRYRMASLFNPYDPTLLSNRATCIFNLRRYRRCIEICQLCFSAFPDLYYEDNTGLYFQILILLANAHLQLRQFSEAIAVHNTLLQVKEKLRAEKDSRTDVTVKEASNKIRRFEMDLRLANSDSWDAGQENPHTDTDKPVRPKNFPYQEERGRFLHPHTPRCYLREINTGIDDYDLASEEDGDPSLIVNVENLCHHVYHMGMGACAHDDDDFIWPYESDSCSVSGDEGSDEYGFQGAQAQHPHSRDGLVGEGDYEACECHCDEYHEGEEADETEILSEDLCDLPQLKEADSESDDESTNDDLSEALDDWLFSKAESSSEDKKEDVRCRVGSNDGGYTLKPPQHRNSKFSDVLTLREAVEARRMARSTLEQQSPRRNGADAHYWRLVTELACFTSKKMYNPSTVRKGNRLFYDSESEEPMSELDYSLVAETQATEFLEKACALLPEGNDTFLSKCIAQIFGQSFHSNGALDFTRYFGPHSRSQSHSSKKKAKGCDRNCAPCFARRMWKLRFKSYKTGNALQFDRSILGDKPIDEKTFLFPPEWFLSGYYGSGYETAFAVALLVHGIAYLILLQSEVSWQRNGSQNITDMQQRFNTVLFENVKTRNDLRSIFELFCMLSETVNLIDCINYHASKGIPRSHQFTNTSQSVAENLRSTPDLQHISKKDREATLLSRNGTPFENLSNWSMDQYVGKEEEWVYHTLFRDVREIILHFERKSLSIFPNSVPFIMNSTGFEKDLLITGLYRQRSRELEKKSNSRKNVDLRRSERLLNRVLEVHPSTARLYFKRAEVRFMMKHWKSCIKDLSKLQSLVTQSGGKGTDPSTLSERERVLLYHSYNLEGDVHREKAKETSPAQVCHVTTSIDRYRKALAISPRTKKNRTHLLKKIQEQQNRMTAVENKTHGKRSTKPSANNSKPQSKKRSPVKTTVSTSEHNHDTSSSDENEDALVSGSRYGALLGTPKPLPTTGREPPKPAKQRFSANATNSPGNASASGGRRQKKKQDALTVDYILSEVHRILSLFGGEARSSDIMANLDFTQWSISNPKTHVLNTYGTLHGLCMSSGQGFEIRAGSQSDPVIGLTDEGEFTPVSRRKPCPSKSPSIGNERKREVSARGRRRDHPRGRGSSNARSTRSQSKAKAKTRMSQTIHYSKLVNELLTSENEKNAAGSKQKAGAQESDRDKECCICMDNPPDCLTIPCRHPFCEACILDYLARENSAKNCPVCRSDVTNVASMAIH